MNCTQARDRLPALLYGDLPAEEMRSVRDHLTSCPACRDECAALRQVRRLLDAVPAPPAAVDLPRLYREADARRQRRLRLWRRLALAAGAAAAAAVAALVGGPRLEVRLEAHQVVLRWGAPPDAPPPDHRPGPAEGVAAAPPPSLPTDVDERLRLLGDLVQALAADADLRDGRRQQELAGLRAQLRSLQQQMAEMQMATDKDRAAIYSALFPDNPKGGLP
jgi:hypothetical protein